MTATITAPSPTDLLPYIRAAHANVGVRRTDPADVARILRNHGATSTAAEIMIQGRITATLPPCRAPDPARLARYQAERDRSGLDLPAFCYMWQGPAIYGAALIVDDLYQGAMQAVHAWQDACRAAVEAWWQDNASAIQTLCEAEATALLAAREASR